MNKETGLVEEAQLNEVKYIRTRRKDGSLRLQQDYSYCPTMTEQHTAHLSDINILMEKYQPDELAAYLAARAAHKQEILSHDFAAEPSLQDAKNITYKLKQSFEALPEEIKNQFKNHVEFLKFIDNPDNQEKMIKLGILTKKQIQQHTDPIPTTPQNDNPNDEIPLTPTPPPTPNPNYKKDTKK